MTNYDAGAACTPLHMAVHQAHMDMIEFLIGAGANVNFADRDGDTALHVVVTRMKIEADEKGREIYEVDTVRLTSERKARLKSKFNGKFLGE